MNAPSPEANHPAETSPKCLDLPWFAIVHDGTQPEIGQAELELVSQKFDALVSDVQLNYVDRVRHLEGVVAQDTLTLTLPVDAENLWSISVSASGPRAGSEGMVEPEKKIAVQHVEGVFGREGANYYKGADGIVRRDTFGDMAKRVAEQGEDPDNPVPTSDISPAEALPILKNLARVVVNAMENQRLAKDMGYNYQPVCMRELDSLADFLSQPGIAPA